MRRIICKNINNLRDLGGYCTKDGEITKFNSVYRSELPLKMTKEEINYLLNNGLNTVIDLRNKEELKRNKNCLNIKEIKYFNISLDGVKCPDKESDIPNGYMDILNNKKDIYEIFNVIKNSSGSILFNCTAGKDRTGVIAMLFLLLVGVYEEDIIADYQVSYTYIIDKVRNMHKNNPNLPAFFGNSKPEYMENTLKLFYKKYNNITNYFKYLGFSDEEIIIIKSKLI